MRRIIPLFLVIILLCSCGQAPELPEKVNVKKVLNVALEHSPVSLCPVETMDKVSLMTAAPLYHRLFTYNEQGALVPDALESWDLIDELNYKFTLKRNLVFHNGDQLTAKDVIYTIKRVAESPMWGSLLYGVNIDELKAEDEYTILLTTLKPMPDLTTSLATVATSILNHNLGENYNYTQNPIGTGPYKLKEWRPGQFVSYDVNPNLRNQVKNDGIIYWNIPEQEPRIKALEEDNIQIITSVDTSQTLRPLQNGRWIFDLPLHFIAVGANLSKEPMNDLTIPRALRLLTDPEEVASFMGGKAHGGVIPAGASFSESNPATSFHNREQGKAMLTSAGYDDLALTLAISKGDKAMEDLAKVLEQQWLGYGFTLTINRYEDQAYFQALREGRDHLYLHNVQMLSPDPADMLQLHFQTDLSGVAANYSFLSDAGVDNMLESSHVILNPEIRLPSYSALQQRLDELCPWLFIWEPSDILGVSSRISFPDTKNPMLHPERIVVEDIKE
ncbi:MAG: ABC transporter substrate-binding protein [Tissierellia bacterium]|nr:ABC transporter substrate-binding protein [Tissierellia bacterium]